MSTPILFGEAASPVGSVPMKFPDDERRLVPGGELDGVVAPIDDESPNGDVGADDRDAAIGCRRAVDFDLEHRIQCSGRVVFGALPGCV